MRRFPDHDRQRFAAGAGNYSPRAAQSRRIAYGWKSPAIGWHDLCLHLRAAAWFRFQWTNKVCRVEAGIKLSRKARAAFVTPSHQFPLGVTMSASRRFQLLEWAHKTGSWVIEDDYDSEYRFESLPIASLQGLDDNARVIYIGTFSKVLFPSLRLGYIVIPLDLVERFISVRLIMDIAPPDFFQHVIADFMNEGHFARHLRRMRVLYREQRSALVRCMKEELGTMVEVLGSEAGLHLPVAMRTPRRISDLEIAERAARENLWLWPLSPYYAGKPARSGFVLGFGGTRVEEIPPAVKILRKLLGST